MEIVMIGRTGSGKSTQALKLAKSLDLPYIGSGDIARELGEQDPTTRLKLRQGMMAPEEAMRIAVRMKIEEAAATSGGYILDGFPRSVAQLIALWTWTRGPTFIELAVHPRICIDNLLLRNRPDDNPDAIANKLEAYELEVVPMVKLLQEGNPVGSLIHTIDGTGPARDIHHRMMALVGA